MVFATCAVFLAFMFQWQTPVFSTNTHIAGWLHYNHANTGQHLFEMLKCIFCPDFWIWQPDMPSYPWSLVLPSPLTTAFTLDTTETVPETAREHFHHCAEQGG
eukprot:scpid92941/ scgid11931/ 